MKNSFVYGVLSLFLFWSGVSQAKTLEIEVASGELVSLEQYGTGAGDRFLWIPSEYGTRKRHHEHLQGLEKLGHTAAMADLHDSYFIPPGRNSLSKIPLADVVELIEQSLPDKGHKLYIVSSGRGAVLSFLAIHQWLESSDHAERLGGVILLHPNFQAGNPAANQEVRYLPVLQSLALPVFIIQPDQSSKYYYREELIAALQDAGSEVYMQVISDVGDGYHARDSASALERKKADELPGQMLRAARLLAKSTLQTRVNASIDSGKSAWQTNKLPDTLQTFPKPVAAPALQLQDTNGVSWKLADLQGRIVVLNFWTTWCPPCVEEIPSLGRLQKAFPEEKLKVISVDIGEDKQVVAEFLKAVPAGFPVLLDPEGSMVKEWKIRAFPTTFVIDQQGMQRFFYFGGLEWDRPDVIEQLKTL